MHRNSRPLLTNDFWIAEHAMETGSDLMLPDERFAAVEGLLRVPLEPS